MTKLVISIAVLFTICVTKPGWTEEPSGQSKKQQVIDFFNKYIAGRTLTMSRTGKLAGGKIETVFIRQMAFTPCIAEPDGFWWDTITMIRQTNYDLDEQGNRKSPPNKKHRAVVHRWEFRQLKSTEVLVGNRRDLANTMGCTLASAEDISVHLEGKKLVVVEKTIGYDDHFAPNNRWQPGASEFRYLFSVDNGKLRCENIQQAFDVDPTTLKRTPRGGSVTMIEMEME